SSIGRLLDAHEITLTHVSGAVIIVLGAIMLLGALPSRVWAHAGSGTLGLVTRVTGEHRLDAVHRTGPRCRAQAGRRQRDSARRRPALVRLLAGPGRALRARRSRLRP